MIKLWRSEPAAVVATLQTVIALALAFGLKLTVAQVGAILAATTSVGGLLIRSQVASVAALKELAAGQPPVP